MAEKSLLLRPDMARAYAEGRKNQTRRLVKYKGSKPTKIRWNPIVLNRSSEWENEHGNHIKCPYGAPGDHIRLLTTWAVNKMFDDLKPLDLPMGTSVWSYFLSSEKPPSYGRLRPGRFLPMYMRHWMPCPELLDVSVERVHDISEEDAIYEGIDEFSETCDATHEFRLLWEQIHGPGAWERNDWVWRLKLEIGGER